MIATLHRFGLVDKSANGMRASGFLAAKPILARALGIAARSHHERSAYSVSFAGRSGAQIILIQHWIVRV